MGRGQPLLISLKIRGFTAIFSLRNIPATFDAYDYDDGQSGREVVAGFRRGCGKKF